MFELAVPRRLEMPKKVHGGVELEMFSRGDVSIFATNHTVRVVSPSLQSTVYPVLRTCDHLLYEGTTTFKQRIHQFPTHASEKYVMDTFTGKLKHPHDTYPLEEGSNIFEMVHRYGMNKNEMGAYVLLSQFAKPIITAPDRATVEKTVNYGVHNVLSIQDNFTSLDPQEVTRRLLNIWRNKHILPQNIDDEFLIGILQGVTGIAIIYRGFISEYEYIGPTIKKYMERLHGRKGILIGKMHLEAVEKALENEEFVQPVQWGDFIETLDTTRKGIIKTARGLMDLNEF